MTLEWWKGVTNEVPHEEWVKHRHWQPKKLRNKFAYLFLWPEIHALKEDMEELHVIEIAWLDREIRELERKLLEAETK